MRITPEKSLFPTYQSTIADAIEISGVGVHSGKRTAITLHPAPAGTGVVFHRRGKSASRTRVAAHYRNVSATAHCTVLGTDAANSFSTIEHLMAALAGLAIDNVVVEVDGAEMPILDGSAAPFVDALQCAGKASQSCLRRYLKITRPVRYSDGAGFIELHPHAGQYLEIDIDFPSPAIGRQSAAIDLGEGCFAKEVGRARTFGFLGDVEALWRAGFALGASLDNAIVIKDDMVINPGGLRYANEFARHKLLDAIGDLALAGAPILGAFYAYRGGHRLNNTILHTLFADDGAWEMVELPARSGFAGAPAQLAGATLAPEIS